MKTKLLLTLTLILLPALASCARFRTVQIDERKNAKTGEVTTVTTKASAWTFFSAKSSLATWKATQTEKSQGATVGGLEQQGGMTDAFLTNIVFTAVSAAVKSIK